MQILFKKEKNLFQIHVTVYVVDHILCYVKLKSSKPQDPKSTLCVRLLGKNFLLERMIFFKSL